MSHERTKVLTVCGVFAPGFRGGGVVRAILQTIDTAPDDVDVVVVTKDRDLGATEAYPGVSGLWTSRRRSRVFYLNTRSLRQWLRVWYHLRRTQFDVLYVHGLWAPIFSAAPILAAWLGLVRTKKILVSPHGELSPGALSVRGRKKRLFLRVWAPFLRRRNVILHAAAEREASEIRAVCPWATILVNHHQVSLPEEPLPPRGSNDGAARLIYIGRISPKKNLDLVLQALCQVSSRVAFDIYGPVEDADYWSRCQALVHRLPPNVTARYCGELDPAGVRWTFAGYHAFVFPTRGENFGYVIAESLSASCPVLCSNQTPWSGTLHSGGGWVLGSLTSGDLAKKLERIAAMPPAERRQARERAADAYRAWRKGVRNENLLDRLRRADWPLPTGVSDS